MSGLTLDWTEAEAQLLQASWNRVERRAADPCKITELEERARKLFQEEAVPIEEARAGLLERGLIAEDQEGISLSAEGIEVTRILVRDRMRAGFEKGLVRSFESAANQELCRRIYDNDQYQLNMVDSEQWEKLQEVLSLGPDDHLVDLGCALGAISESLSDRFGCRVTGVDFARPAIAAARERTRDKAHRLHFEVGDLNELQLPAQSFDAAISVDTLYFVHELDRVVEDIVGLVRPGGCVTVFWSQQRPEDGDPGLLAPGSTAVAVALDACGIPWQSWEFTSQAQELWTRTMVSLDALEADFEAEGNTDLWDSRRKEAVAMGKAYRAERVRRYLYLGRV
jgi:ubiquinone/menaquinone biosynthesis C-methylase UbiE